MNRVLLHICLISWTCGPLWAGEKPRHTPHATSTPPAGTPGPEKQHYTLYAQATADEAVLLASGTTWRVKKGDVFPVLMFKEQQTIAVLQLGGTTFRLATEWLQTVEAKDLTEEQVAAYRSALQSYLDKVAEEAKANLPGGK